MSRKRVTIKEVAQTAGVSTQTVSRVVNGRPDVSPDTRQHVQEVIDQLGYQPSKIARSLIQGQSFSLGVVSSNISLYGPSHVLQGIQETAKEMGYSLMLHILPDPEVYEAKKLLREIMSYHVDGILWAMPEIGQNRDWIQQELSNLSVPIAFLNVQPRPNQATVIIDNRAGGRLATKHLLEQGRQNIGIITGPMSWWEARQRELGWREELVANGRSVDESYITHGDWTPSSGERGIRMLLDWHPEMDAVFACNDQMALGAMKIARQMGRRIPEDLAIVGFDNIPEAPYFDPALSTVYQDLTEMGREGVKQLLAMINNPDAYRPDPIRIQPELIVRDSS
ncbi:MAG: LacI family DNA-binding transcriptional regulator [Anaerolineae bacterium]|nr:LacI family DNA-binding transcriptional regulator [Anaerolineae bacterium]